MATLKDVAKLACVDVSTVSRALNNTSYVHPDTKKKIYRAAGKLGYKPNLIAKSLRQGKCNTIGVVVPNINLSVFGDIVLRIEAEAAKKGYSIMICNTKDRQDLEEKYLQRLRNGLVDGIIIAPTGQNQRLIRDIRSSEISVIQIVRKQDKEIDSVVANYYTSAYDGVKFLVKKECKSIGFINGSMEIVPYKDRYDGYHKAMKKFALEEHVIKSTLPIGDYFKVGYEGTLRLLEEVENLDAIMVAVDMQGMGAIRALKDKGKKIPKEVKVLSLTGQSIGSLLETSMTSMELPTKGMGEQALNVILEEINVSQEEKQAIKHIVFEPVLIERETT